MCKGVFVAAVGRLRRRNGTGERVRHCPRQKKRVVRARYVFRRQPLDPFSRVVYLHAAIQTPSDPPSKDKDPSRSGAANRTPRRASDHGRTRDGRRVRPDSL